MAVGRVLRRQHLGDRLHLAEPEPVGPVQRRVRPRRAVRRRHPRRPGRPRREHPVHGGGASAVLPAGSPAVRHRPGVQRFVGRPRLVLARRRDGLRPRHQHLPRQPVGVLQRQHPAAGAVVRRGRVQPRRLPGLRGEQEHEVLLADRGRLRHRLVHPTGVQPDPGPGRARAARRRGPGGAPPSPLTDRSFPRTPAAGRRSAPRGQGKEGHVPDAWTRGWACIDRIDAELPCAAGGAGPAAVPAARPTITGARLEERIADGGTGTVYRACLDDGTAAAVKVGDMAGSRHAARARFARERALLDRLDHPGIVRAVADGRTADGRPWIATEFVEGIRIDAACTRRGTGDGACIQLVMQVLDALDHAHANGVVHRDVKPSNILVGTGGVATLIDFGAARDLDRPEVPPTDATETGSIVGTLAWISPEQADPSIGDVGPAVDVYQSALLLYRLLTGEMPYPGRPSHPAAMLRAALAEERVPASARRPDLDGPLSALLARALARDPARRPPTARDFCLELMDACCVLG
ncbi:MAG: serine/threonine protein kinase [Phycisphaerales bacterium]|nr:serine/threonine protein kinase [Phycisphaerales bacterium]